MDVQIPNLPDVTGKYTQDQQLQQFLVAVKITLEILTGTDINSNTSVVDLLNDNQ
jgi:hypothetical protein